MFQFGVEGKMGKKKIRRLRARPAWFTGRSMPGFDGLRNTIMRDHTGVAFRGSLFSLNLENFEIAIIICYGIKLIYKIRG